MDVRNQRAEEEYGTTVDAAKILGLKPTTFRRGLCVAGHYLGIKPVKLPNGRLLWPLHRVRALVDGGK